MRCVYKANTASSKREEFWWEITEKLELTPIPKRCSTHRKSQRTYKERKQTASGQTFNARGDWISNSSIACNAGECVSDKVTAVYSNSTERALLLWRYCSLLTSYLSASLPLWRRTVLRFLCSLQRCWRRRRCSRRRRRLRRGLCEILRVSGPVSQKQLHRTWHQWRKQQWTYRASQ